MQAIANIFGLFVELMRPILAPFVSWLAPTLTPFIERAGAINVLILLSLMVWLLIFLAIALIIMHLRRMLLKTISLHREWLVRREAEALRRKKESVTESLRVAQDCVDIGMAPSLMFPRAGADEGSISGMFLAVCANGGVARIVEGPFHDPECEHPCVDHPECQLAH